MSISCKEIVGRVKDLLPMPEVSMALSSAMQDENCSVSDIAEIIHSDPVLSAKLLRIANSPFYSYQGKIDSLNRAVMLVGTNGVRELVWACESISRFTRLGLSKEQLNGFWDHSLYTAIAAKTLAAKCKHPFAERVFLTGLLHDIGLLVMFQAIPGKMHWVWDVALQHGKSIPECERIELGIDHYQVGAEFLKQWQLPQSVVEVVGRQNGRLYGDEIESAILKVATHIAYHANFGYGLSGSVMPVEADAWHRIGLSEKIVDAVQQISLESFTQLRNSFFGAKRNMAA
jgi:putative nucleotidyltransferase with HDIG domain